MSMRIAEGNKVRVLLENGTEGRTYRNIHNFIKIKTENLIKRYYLYEINKKKREGIKMRGSEEGVIIWQE